MRVRDCSIAWDKASCSGEPLDNWFLGSMWKEEGKSTTVLRSVLRRSKKVCESCPIRKECLEYALEHHEWGIWGGTTREQRRLILRQRRGQAVAAVS